MPTVQDIRNVTRKTIKQAGVIGIAAGAKATARIPCTGTHYALFLRCLTAGGVALTRAQMIADVGNIILRINGKQILEATATFLLDRQKYYTDSISAGNVSGIIPIFFTLPHLESDPERRVLGWGMQGVDSFEVEVNILGVAQLATMEVYSEVSDEVRAFGRHIRIRKFPNVYALTGLQEVNNLAREDGLVDYVALHIETPGAAVISKVTVKVNNVSIIDNEPSDMNQVRLEFAKRNPQALYHHIDFGLRDDLGSVLPMAGVTDFRQELTWATAAPNNYNIYAEMAYNDLSR